MRFRGSAPPVRIYLVNFPSDTFTYTMSRNIYGPPAEEYPKMSWASNADLSVFVGEVLAPFLVQWADLMLARAEEPRYSEFFLPVNPGKHNSLRDNEDPPIPLSRASALALWGSLREMEINSGEEYPAFVPLSCLPDVSSWVLRRYAALLKYRAHLIVHADLDGVGFYKGYLYAMRNYFNVLPRALLAPSSSADTTLSAASSDLYRLLQLLDRFVSVRFDGTHDCIFTLMDDCMAEMVYLESLGKRIVVRARLKSWRTIEICISAAPLGGLSWNEMVAGGVLEPVPLRSGSGEDVLLPSDGWKMGELLRTDVSWGRFIFRGDVEVPVLEI